MTVAQLKQLDATSDIVSDAITVIEKKTVRAGEFIVDATGRPIDPPPTALLVPQACRTALLIEAFEMKMASLCILVPPVIVLIGTAVAVAGPGLEYAATDTGEIKSNLNNPAAHGFSEVLYAFSSAGNNNGSAFGGLTGNTPFYNTALGLCMVLGRFIPMIFVIALAGSLSRQKPVPVTAGTLPTHRALFITMLVGVVIIVTGLTYFPSLTLGPLAEGL